MPSFFLMIRRPPRSTLFPYTTLFRSVVDIVGPAVRIVVETDHFLHDQNEILGIQNTVLLCIQPVDAQTLVQTVAADRAEVIALEVEKHGVDHLLGILFGRQIARPETLVHFAIGFSLIVRRVFEKRGLEKFILAIISIGKSRLDALLIEAERLEQSGNR